VECGVGRGRLAGGPCLPLPGLVRVPAVPPCDGAATSVFPARRRHGARTLAVVAALIAAGCAATPAGRSADSAAPAASPPTAKAAQQPSPPVRQVLPNGLRLIMQDHRAADIVAVYLYVGVGGRYERPDQLG